MSYNKEYSKKWYSNNKTKLLSKRKIKRDNNLEQARKYQREYMNKHRKTPKWKEFNLKQTYGISLKEYNLILEIQNNKCAACNKDFAELPSRHIHLDHNHKSNKIRGILCWNCNHALGNCKDSIFILESLIVYLKKHEELH